ncbi:hypothetical protein [Umezawaea sp. Da 62-37]|uniref:hypothetical protein n=1 Tax=Umezawaea sp. Da 62-37 TaxID=3075927 RepID=UPI0028F70B68|nr:hypothetical protein [Umezawaea sp. Da 62-37]WNV90219.1 hypothetical protein RM788_18575 [Umezawaea sp. Da 62-37]
MCWLQAKRARDPEDTIDVLAGNRHGQQLFLANMSSSKNGHRPHPRTRRRIHRPRHSPTTADSDQATSLAPNQQDLFTPRPYEQSVRRYGFGDPPTETVAERLGKLVAEHGARHGWSQHITTQAHIGTRVLLAMRGHDTTSIRTSEVDELIPLGLSARPVLDVLAGADLLVDDRTAPVRIYFERQVRDLPDPMLRELRTWFAVLHEGSTTAPRSKPRAPGTIKSRILWALPHLRTWAEQGHHSLREISRDDILDVLPAGGTPRAGVGGALRSIFSTLKAHKVTFTNPTAHMNMGNYERPIPLPANTDTVRTLMNVADPTAAALATLIVFHGLSSAELRTLRQTDLRDGRAYLGNRIVPLAEPVKAQLRRYLDYRHQRWPGSINTHFFVHYLNTGSDRPVTSNWINKRIGMSPRTLRQDRILDETIATGGDMRRVCDFFGVVMATAMHYATVLDHPSFTDEPRPSKT